MNQEKERQELASIFAHALIQATTQTDISLLSRINKFLYGRDYKTKHSVNQDAIINASIEMADKMNKQLNRTEYISDPIERKYVYLVFTKENILVGCFDTEEKAKKYANDSPNAIVITKCSCS